MANRFDATSLTQTLDAMKTQAALRDNAWLKRQRAAFEKLHISGDIDFAELSTAKLNLKKLFG